MDALEPPRKRQRSDTSTIDESDTALSGNSSPGNGDSAAGLRDPQFYKDGMDGGFCIIRVENVLFKVCDHFPNIDLTLTSMVSLGTSVFTIAGFFSFPGHVLTPISWRLWRGYQ